VPFLKELECIKEYVALEQADPASKFSIKYDINYSDFYIPILTVQPMVENAIRHGIAGRGADGLVRLSTDLEGDEIFIRVEDNGWGYVSETKQQAEHRSTGIKNTRERLKLMCKGELNIINTGQGTIVRIEIPLDETKHVI
jgi:LytS/YehU family sensor histidine kinase